jgi:ribokinase
MTRILMSGNTNIETTVRVDAFPVSYHSGTFVPFGVQTHVSGVGNNVAKALITLGNAVTFTSIIGRDLPATMIRATLAADGIDDRFVLSQIEQTTQSVALYDAQGRRHFFTDPKNMREQTYPVPLFRQAIANCDALVLTNVPYNRALITLAKQTGKPIATDVQRLLSPDDPYNQPFWKLPMFYL